MHELLELLIDYVDIIAEIIEFIGVMIMFLGLLFAIVRATLGKYRFTGAAYKSTRLIVGKSILLGLEILIAADIMETVVTKPTMESVTVLGLIVLIRTFLSFSLQVELEGELPWRRNRTLSETKDAEDVGL